MHVSKNLSLKGALHDKIYWSSTKQFGSDKLNISLQKKRIFISQKFLYGVYIYMNFLIRWYLQKAELIKSDRIFVLPPTLKKKNQEACL